MKEESKGREGKESKGGLDENLDTVCIKRYRNWCLAQASSERFHTATDGRGAAKHIGARGVTDTPRKPTDSTNLASQTLKRMGATRDRPRPSAYML